MGLNIYETQQPKKPQKNQKAILQCFSNASQQVHMYMQPANHICLLHLHFSIYLNLSFLFYFFFFVSITQSRCFLPGIYDLEKLHLIQDIIKCHFYQLANESYFFGGNIADDRQMDKDNILFIKMFIAFKLKHP